MSIDDDIVDAARRFLEAVDAVAQHDGLATTHMAAERAYDALRDAIAEREKRHEFRVCQNAGCCRPRT